MALSHAIMTALIEDDMSGYELAKAFDASLGLFWNASHQQIYQELRKLAEKGWLNRRKVAQRGKPDKILYGLTLAGREALGDWVYRDSRVQESKDDLLVKLYNLSAENIGHPGHSGGRAVPRVVRRGPGPARPGTGETRRALTISRP